MTRLKRICSGLYETHDGRFEIQQGDRGLSWAGEWIVRSTHDRYWYTDPLPTLRDARLALEDMVKEDAKNRGEN